jgi:hypothetical protein
MSENARIIAEFESLGDNCEFGFVQRYHGLEPGGLLRWASSSVDGLIEGLHRRFAGLYELIDLVPYTHNMVLDRKYGIAFHSEMRSVPIGNRLKFEATGDMLCAIHWEEHQKISYLIGKLTDALAEGKQIFVYKRNSGLSPQDVRTLRAALDVYCDSSRLLCVTAASGRQPAGTVSLVGRRTKLATIKKLAPYTNVESALYPEWTALCCEAYSGPWE